jgi:TPR repeat protein
MLQRDFRMGTVARLKRPIFGALIIGFTSIAACSPPDGTAPSTQPQTVNQATYKADLVLDDAPNVIVAQGDKALKRKDYAIALQRYEDASKDVNEKVQGSALNRLGELYDRGLGVRQDRLRSFDLYQKSAILDNPYGQANLANALFFGLGTGRNLKEAIRWALKGAEGNIPMAINQVGWQYRTGMGVPVDTVEARRRYQQSAELGDSTGESQLGWMYAHVEPIDYQLAMKWYRKAADQNDLTSENNIGFLYENGLGVSQDYIQAASWYQKAAAMDYARAQFHLGNLYALGHGVALDPKKARELISKASDGGDEEASQWVSKAIK